MIGEEEARALAIGFGQDGEAAARMDRFVELLLAANREQNLISRASEAELWGRHILDSAQLLRFADGDRLSWLDLGSGPGLPGLVMAALRPQWQVTLVEPRKQRCVFLRHSAETLGLNHVRVEESRAENAALQKVDVISARALSDIATILRLGGRFAHSDTLWLLHRGRNWVKELEELGPRRARMFHVEHSLTSDEARILVGRPSSGG